MAERKGKWICWSRTLICTNDETNSRRVGSIADPQERARVVALVNACAGYSVEEVAEALAILPNVRGCSQCGQRFSALACGPTHAVVWNELCLVLTKPEASR